MSHSQFHCTARVYLDMHGLIFETSICYWQDQPGSRATGHDPTGPARRRPLSLLPSLSLSPARSAFPSGPCRVDGGGRRGERLSAGRAALRRSLARSLADHDGEARPIPGAAPPTSPPRGRSGDRCAAAFGGTLRAPPAGAGLALAPHGRPGLTRPPGPAEKRTGKRSPAAGDGCARGERDLETGATPRSETLSRGGTLRSGRGRGRENRHGLRRPEGGGEAGGRPRPPHPDGSGAGRAALLRARPLGRAQPPVVFSFLLLLLLLASPRFPAVSLGCHPAGLLLAAGTRRAPKRGQRRRLAHNEMGTPAARGAARPSHSWIRSGEPWGTDRAGGQTSRHGEATRPEAAAAAALGPSGRAPHLANDGKRTGEEAARA
ncbi:translation initiation factor IF-2-like [Gallus gallus]|uniref:translation initiation factor IF-2-like n=1 Tax=Gallus gallus TaxID=9031 RepID=UPI001F01C4BE|nr:translation initiation factor IF-2-like [Gallus gallus]